MIDAFQGIPLTTHYFKALLGEVLVPFRYPKKEYHSYFVMCVGKEREPPEGIRVRDCGTWRG